MTDIDLLYAKEIDCPACGQGFSSKKVRMSRLRLIKRDEDFLSHYKDINPLLYSVFVCPDCGYAGLEDKFTSLRPGDQELVREKVTSKWKTRSYGGIRNINDGIESHKLALYIGEILDYSRLELGNLCLSLAWLYRIQEDQEEYRFLELAKNLYQAAYYNESLVATAMDELKLTYLMGELNRRLGNKAEAVQWFNTAISNPDLGLNKALETLVREQWRLAREG